MEVAPDSVENVPARHLMHCVDELSAVSEAQVPVVHFTHVLDDVAPAFVE